MRDKRTRLGFTLIELAVVLLIIGVCASMIVLLVRPDERATVALEAERLARLLELAELEARLTASPITWTSDGRGYGFLRHPAADRETRTHDDDTLRPRILPSGVTIGALRVESSVAPVLRIDFAPHAPPPAFVMELSSSTAAVSISGSPLGQVRVNR